MLDSSQMELLAPAPAGVRFAGRPVPAPALRTAGGLLAHFNAAMGTAYRPLTASGKPSENLKRILGAVLEHDIELELGRRMIEAAAARPWWRAHPGTGVVFGPNVVERSMTAAQMGAPLEAPAPGLERLAAADEQLRRWASGQ